MGENLRMTKQYYDRYWQDKEELSDLPYKWPAIRTLFPNRSLTFLDFGCGSGVLTTKIHSLHPDYHIFGVDISPKALRATKKRIPPGTFRLITNTQRIPYPDKTFDFVLAADVLEHIYDTATAFSELARVVKPKGTILISVPYNGTLKMLLAVLFGFEFYFDPHSPHIRHYSPKTLSKEVERVGLSVEKIGFFGRFYPLSRGMFLLAHK